MLNFRVHTTRQPELLHLNRDGSAASAEFDGEEILKKLFLITAACVFFLAAGYARAQQFDVGFGVSGLQGPPASSASGNYSPQTIGGGSFLTFSGDYLLKHQLGVQGEVSWRKGQNLYLGFQPFRPIFYDFNGIWAPQLTSRIGAELMAGIGAESIRFYQPNFVCSAFSGCTNYTSRNHFMGHLGGGMKLYLLHNVFIRPEAHLYLVHNNVEFSGARAARYGVSIGYTWRSE